MLSDGVACVKMAMLPAPARTPGLERGRSQRRKHEDRLRLDVTRRRVCGGGRREFLKRAHKLPCGLACGRREPRLLSLNRHGLQPEGKPRAASTATSRLGFGLCNRTACLQRSRCLNNSLHIESVILLTGEAWKRHQQAQAARNKFPPISTAFRMIPHVSLRARLRRLDRGCTVAPIPPCAALRQVTDLTAESTSTDVTICWRRLREVGSPVATKQQSRPERRR